MEDGRGDRIFRVQLPRRMSPMLQSKYSLVSYLMASLELEELNRAKSSGTADIATFKAVVSEDCDNVAEPYVLV
jgi:hypothetical protein